MPTMGLCLESARRERWGVILAGGDGVRLRPLTRRIAGDDRPKQFCPLLGRETLLDRTRRRAAGLIQADRLLVVLTRAHEPFYAPVLGDAGSQLLAIQPENRGTAPAILYGLLRIAALAPRASVAIFPSDHHVADDDLFMRHAGAAFGALVDRPDLIVLLGITPDGPEVEYGWIEPGEPILGPQALYRVGRFWEKPSSDLAAMLWSRGCLWNSFVMVARVPALLALIRKAMPDLYHAFVAVRPTLGTPLEGEVLRPLYAHLPPTNFSKEVLETHPGRLAVLPVSGVGWTDLGDPRRVLDMRRQALREPDPLVA